MLERHRKFTGKKVSAPAPHIPTELSTKVKRGQDGNKPAVNFTHKRLVGSLLVDELFLAPRGRRRRGETALLEAAVVGGGHACGCRTKAGVVDVR